MQELIEKAQNWLSTDPDETTRTQLELLLKNAKDNDENAIKELKSCFQGPLVFGTAGLRGKIGPGESCMNRAVVMRAAYGLASYLLEKVGPDFTVVIGNDARHYSRQFALDTAGIVTAIGGKAIILPDRLPTPVLAFSVRHLNTDAGVMVTASHNPPQDNGYKVYLGGRAVDEIGRGAQIVPPYDADIAQHISLAPAANAIEVATTGWEDLNDEVVEAYISRALSLIPNHYGRDLKIVHTAMHGVGSKVALRVINEAGFYNVTPVAAQQEPDPDFPTVSFPNPEEPGALDLAISQANALKADLVIANDPDADRVSAAIPQKDGSWKQITGDEIGAILGQQTAQAHALSKKGTLANSIVSSRLLSQIAAVHGMNYQATLTGFKWISRAKDIAFGYEEAIGYCVDPEGVKDKDGITAALQITYLTAKLKEEGKTLQDALDELAMRHGLFVTSQVSLRVEDLSLIAKAMDKVRNHTPETLGGFAITTKVDLNDGYQGLPPTDAMLLETSQNSRVIVRPSGTEPKLKCYLEVVVPVVDHSLETAKAQAHTQMQELRADVTQMVTP